MSTGIAWSAPIFKPGLFYASFEAMLEYEVVSPLRLSLLPVHVIVTHCVRYRILVGVRRCSLVTSFVVESLDVRVRSLVAESKG